MLNNLSVNEQIHQQGIRPEENKMALFPLALRAGGALAARNPAVVSRITGPLTRVVATYGPEASKKAASKGLKKGLFFGSLASLAVDPAIDAVEYLVDLVSEEPDAVKEEVTEMIKVTKDPKLVAPLIELINEMSTLAHEGIPYAELSPEMASDVIRETGNNAIYGTPGTLMVPDAKQRADNIRMVKMYSSLRSVFSPRQINAMCMVSEIAALPNKIELLDYLEEEYNR